MLLVSVTIAILTVLNDKALASPIPAIISPLFSKALNCYENPNTDGSCPYDDITFWLYTRNEPNGTQITADNMNSLPVEKGSPWKIIFHGFNSDKDDSPGIHLKGAYFKHGPYNIMLVDYRAPFMRNRSYLCYPWAATDSLDLVASCSAQFLYSLLKAGVLPGLDQWHMIGHSLGAHTAASICHRLNELGYGKVARLTGLDPAGPLFSRNNTRSIRLFEAEDAVFVDAYHTNGGDTIKQFGTKEDRAHTDIRFNGGALQPACNGDISCNHERAVIYYGESIHPLPPNNCEFKGHHLNLNETFELILVGEYISHDVRGTLFVSTNSHPPYAQNCN